MSDCLPIVYAGFPSPADDYLEQALDIRKYLVTNEPATFYMRVAGDSMTVAGINEGDILVIDRSLNAKAGDIAIANIDSGFVVKRLSHVQGQWLLESANPSFPPIPVASPTSIWGVVTFAIHPMVR